MANMVDFVRILLKAYKEELTLEQIIQLLANKNQTKTQEVKDAIPELLSTNTIIQTNGNKYKIANNDNPNYFYVFQSKSFNKEIAASCLFCPISKDNRTYRFWESIKEVKKGDIIFHEANKSVFAISEAQSEAQDAAKPYDFDNPEQGRTLTTTYAVLANQIEPIKLKDQLLEAQPDTVAPFNKTGKGNEGYLFYFNDDCAKIIIEGILNN